MHRPIHGFVLQNLIHKSSSLTDVDQTSVGQATLLMTDHSLQLHLLHEAIVVAIGILVAITTHLLSKNRNHLILRDVHIDLQRLG